MTSLGYHPAEQGRDVHLNDHTSSHNNIKALNHTVMQDEYLDAEAIFSLRNIEARYPHLRFSIIEMGILFFLSPLLVSILCLLQ